MLRVRRSALVVLILASASLSAAPAQAAPATFTVNSTADVGDLTCDATCTLRDAIDDANTNANPNELDIIQFDFAGTSTQTILATNQYDVTQRVRIDGSVGDNPIEVDGDGAGFDSGFIVTAANVELIGLTINAWNGTNAWAIRLKGDGAVVRGCKIGTEPDGLTARGNRFGIEIIADGAEIGGTLPAHRNVISGNFETGIRVSGGTLASKNTIRSNYIGVGSDGTTNIGNAEHGIHLVSGAGNDIGPGNVISGNLEDGILIAPGNSNIGITLNHIGTSAVDPTLDVGNGTGIVVSGSELLPTSNVSIGPGRNVIAGSTGFGIDVSAHVSSISIKGNYIGTGNGTTAVSNEGGGVRTQAPGTVIGGSVIGSGDEGNLISGNGTQAGADGIEVLNASGVLITDNEIGTTLATQGALPNGGAGIRIHDSPDVVVGGDQEIERNVISGNKSVGVVVFGEAADRTTITGNRIGTNFEGNLGVRNEGGGILIQDADDSFIGGIGPFIRNLISAHTPGDAGVSIAGTATGTIVRGNFIGTQSDGSTPLGNSVGVMINAPGTVIGGTGTGETNTISGNDDAGIRLSNGATGALIQGNRVGTESPQGGAVPVPNGVGVYVTGTATGNTIGGTVAGATNVISGNTSFGVLIDGASGNTVQGNWIGRNQHDTGNSPNGSGGVSINGSSTTASGNTIGGTEPGAGNRIRGNAGDGVSVIGDVATGNRILGNHISENTGLGIDLFPDDVTTNDAGDADTGSNRRQNFPELTGATTGPNGSAVQGSLNSAVSTDYRIEFFATPACDASGHGEGQMFLGSEVVSILGGGAGSAPFDATLPTGIPTGHVVTATATNLTTSDTSEFSACLSSVTPDNEGPSAEIDTMPQALSENDSPAFTYDANEHGADFECRLFLQGQPADPFSECEPDGESYPGLADGSYSFQVRALDRYRNEGPADSFDFAIDTLPPAVVSPSTPSFQLDGSGKFSWPPAADGSGTTSYTFHSRTGGATGVFGPASDTEVTTTSHTVPLSPGTSTCASVAGEDGLEHKAAFGNEDCVAMPLDERALTRRGRWRARSAADAYLGTVLQTRRKGPSLRLVNARVDELVLIVTKCPRCGAVKVFFNGQVLKKVGLKASSRRRGQVVSIVNFPTPTTGTLRIVSIRDRLAAIEGVGILTG